VPYPLATEEPPDPDLVHIRDLIYEAIGIPLHETEQSVLGFTHCESRRLLAERWELSADLIEVIALHHTPKVARDHAGLVALVDLSDQLCRVSGLHNGYIEQREVNLLQQASFDVLSEQCQQLNGFDWARMTFELDFYMDELHTLMNAVYRI
jgi:HD-like signal output (HDOD) protein